VGRENPFYTSFEKLISLSIRLHNENAFLINTHDGATGTVENVFADE
jgi:hypothetical protein